jgi:hypothetical protein
MDYQKYDKIVDTESRDVNMIIKQKEKECDDIVTLISSGAQNMGELMDKYYILKQDIMNLTDDL